MIRSRFYINQRKVNYDYRPVIWPIKYPYWLSGESAKDYIMIAYADSEEDIYKQWPEAYNLDNEEVDKIEFTDRFPKPNWYNENGEVSERFTYEELEEKYDEIQKEIGEANKAIKESNNTILKQIKTIEELNNKYIRALADYQNLQRNSSITISNSREAGKISFIKDILNIIDNFEKAIESEEISDGIKIIYNELQNVLKSNNIEIINPNNNDDFTESLHEAVAAVPGDKNNKNKIAFTQLKGYKLGNNIIRYAKVGVYV